MTERSRMPLWGWGEPDRERLVPQPALDQLADRFGELPDAEARAGIEDFRVPEPAISDGALNEIRGVVGPEWVSDSLEDRLLRSGGKSYPDLVRMRAGEPEAVPDVVVSPAGSEEVQRLLEVCTETRTAVVPFGGGTSVVGGLMSVSEGFDGSVVLDLGRLEGLAELDQESRIARFRAGTLGPHAEELLGPFGLTTGHFPQSFLYGSIGGFAATRSAGQASTGYGRFDSNVLGLKVATPVGTIDLPPMPGTAAGPGIRSLLVGSEGTLGIITDVSLQVHPAPEVLLDRAWVVDGFESGIELLRGLEQSGCAPAVARLSDPEETEVTLGLAAGSRAGRLLGRYAQLRGGERPCLMITGFEGTRAAATRCLADATSILRSGGARSLGSKAGQAWRHGRFEGPYLRDALMDRGLMVDTLETAASWSGVTELYSAVESALRRSLSGFGGEPIVMCHVSHLYLGGCSLYFTFVGKQPGLSASDRIANWLEVKSAACEAIASSGGTITHHHAIGTDHKRWMKDEIGETALAALVGLKRELDPAGILNPGKLVPGSSISS